MLHDDVSVDEAVALVAGVGGDIVPGEIHLEMAARGAATTAADESFAFLHRAENRVLSRDVVAQSHSPSGRTSTRDGFAVASSRAAQGGDLEFTVSRRLGATAGSPLNCGTAAPSDAEKTEAVRVTTGAVVPDWCDSVIPIEWCRFTPGSAAHNGETPADITAKGERSGGDYGKEGAVFCVSCEKVRTGTGFVAEPGVDVREGEVVARAGQVVTPTIACAIASCGVRECYVRNALRAVVVATGDELVPPGTDLAQFPNGGHIYATNPAFICSDLRRLGVVVTGVHFAGDSVESVRETVLNTGVLRNEVDMVVTIGGVWGSERDCTVEALRGVPGYEQLFRHIKLGPGKSATCGFIRPPTTSLPEAQTGGGRGCTGPIIVFSLPGAPNSCVAAYTMVVAPAICRVLLRTENPPFRTLFLPLANDISRDKGKGWTQVLPGKITTNNNASAVTYINHNRSSPTIQIHSRVLCSTQHQDCFIILTPSQSTANTGDYVPIILIP